MADKIPTKNKFFQKKIQKTSGLQRVGPAEEPGAGAAEERDAAQRVPDQEPRDREEDQGDSPQAEAGGGGQPQVTVQAVLRIRDVYPGSRIRKFFHPGSEFSSSRIRSFFIPDSHQIIEVF